MNNVPPKASVNPRENRIGPIITPQLVATMRELKSQNKTVNEIADLINWPWHCSLKRIREWTNGY